MNTSFCAQFLRELLFDDEHARHAFVHVASGEAMWINKLLLRDLILGVCRLIDRGNQNLTPQRLVDSAKGWLSDEVVRQISDRLDRVGPECSRLRKARNKTIAHLDHAVALGTKKIETTSFDDAVRVLETCQDAINLIEVDFGWTATQFNKVISSMPGNLVSALQTAAWHDELGELIYRGLVTNEQAGSFIRGGWTGWEWHNWCEENGIKSKLFPTA